MDKNKDPAFLFYSSDFLTGTCDLTMEERGQYITLICLQHQKGHLTDKTIRLCLGLGSDMLSVDILNKFEKDEEGLLFNRRIEEEIDKRKNFNMSRRKNGKKGGRPKTDRLLIGLPTENLSENENENENKDINKDINYQEIINLFNSICASLPKVAKVTQARRDKIKTRYKELKTIEAFREIFEITEQSDFLTGKKEKWKATFDWLMENETNYTKVLEGNYKNKEEKSENTANTTGDGKVSKETEQSAYDYGKFFT